MLLWFVSQGFVPNLSLTAKPVLEEQCDNGNLPRTEQGFEQLLKI
jgi:hypothetical protein